MRNLKIQPIARGVEISFELHFLSKNIGNGDPSGIISPKCMYVLGGLGGLGGLGFCVIYWMLLETRYFEEIVPPYFLEDS